MTLVETTEVVPAFYIITNVTAVTISVGRTAKKVCCLMKFLVYNFLICPFDYFVHLKVLMKKKKKKTISVKLIRPSKKGIIFIVLYQ